MIGPTGTPILINGQPIKITIDYAWIGEQIRKRLGYLPDDIERVLMELAEEQNV